VEKTGKHESTVRRALKKMASIHDLVTGEEYPMVEEIEQDRAANRWRALDVDLVHVARMLGIEGAGDKQKRQHKREQKLFADRLSRNGNLQ
jgi:hypothetical protein